MTIIPLHLPTLDLKTFDVDDLVEQTWATLVAQGREPWDRGCWELGYRMGVVGVLQPMVERKLKQG